MLSWQDAQASADAWDRSLMEIDGYNVFQSFAWGEYKRTEGWTPWRLWARDERGEIAGMIQILIKSLPAGISIGWSPGGPVTQRTAKGELESLLESLSRRMAQRGPRWCVRFDNYLPRSDERISVFSKLFNPAIFRINSSFSVCLNLDQPIDLLIERLASKHHKRELAKALRADIQWKIGNDREMVGHLSGLYHQMATQKKINDRDIDAARIARLCQALKDRAVILTGFVDGTAVASSLSLTFGHKALYMVAATNRDGRRVSASYAMLHRLLDHLRREGITEFDFGGVNPRSADAAGVNYFKQGFGGTVVERVGEWERASSPPLRWMFNLALFKRKLAQ